MLRDLKLPTLVIYTFFANMCGQSKVFSNKSILPRKTTSGLDLTQRGPEEVTPGAHSRAPWG